MSTQPVSTEEATSEFVSESEGSEDPKGVQPVGADVDDRDATQDAPAGALEASRRTRKEDDSWWRRTAEALEGLLLLVGLGFAGALLFIRIIGVIARTTADIRAPGLAFESAYAASALLAVTLLPAALTFVGKLAATRAVRQSFNPREVQDFLDGSLWSAVPTIEGLRIDPQVQARAAARQWSSECGQVDLRTGRFELQASLYGVLASLTLMICTSLALVAWNRGIPEDGWRKPLVTLPCAVIAAVVVAFGRDFGRMLARAARRDISSTMMAMASRNLLVVVVAACMLRTLLSVIPGTPDQGHAVLFSLLAGAFAAILGDRAMDVVMDRLALLFGVKLANQQRAVALSTIDGMTAGDIERLAEEGIDSVNALAFATTARVYFHTPYSLQRICQWQDQALLIERLGVERARQWKTEFGIGGIIAAPLTPTPHSPASRSAPPVPGFHPVSPRLA